MQGEHIICSHANHRGDVIARSNLSGSLTSFALYEAYGTRPYEWGDDPDRQKANTKEEESDLGLLNEGMRFRDLETGVFLTRDPIGYGDGPNVYCYVHCNPITHFDALGLMSESDAMDEAEDYFENNYDGDIEDFDDWYDQDDWYSQLADDGYTIYSDDYSEVVMASSAKEARESVFVVTGQNYDPKNPIMMKDGSQKTIADYKAKGYDVNTFHASDLPSTASSKDITSPIMNGFENIVNLAAVEMFSHSVQDINLGYFGARGGFNSGAGSANQNGFVPISDIKISNRTAGFYTKFNGCNKPAGNNYVNDWKGAVPGGDVFAPKPGLGLEFHNGNPTPVAKTIFGNYSARPLRNDPGKGWGKYWWES